MTFSLFISVCTKSKTKLKITTLSWSTTVVCPWHLLCVHKTHDTCCAFITPCVFTKRLANRFTLGPVSRNWRKKRGTICSQIKPLCSCLRSNQEHMASNKTSQSMYWRTWCCCFLCNLAVHVVLATNKSCPAWHYYSNDKGQCECGYGLIYSNKVLIKKWILCYILQAEKWLLVWWVSISTHIQHHRQNAFRDAQQC